MADISFNRQTTISFPDSDIPDITRGIVGGSLGVREILCTDKISFGDINSNQFQVSLYNCPDLTGKKIKVTQTDLDTGDTVDVFTGWVDSCRADDLTGFRNIVAYDYFYKARRKKIKGWWKNFWSSRKSATVGTIWRDMLNYYNVPYVDTALLCDTITFKKTKKTSKLKVTRFTDFLSQVCELGMCIPNINRSGAIEFLKLYDLDITTFVDIRGDYNIKNSKFEDYVVAPYDKIEIYNENSELVSESGDGENVLALQNNLFLYSKKKIYTDDIANMLLTSMHNFDYVPGDIEMKLANQNLKLGMLVRTDKGLCLISENNFTGSLLVNQNLRSAEREEGVEIQNGKAKSGNTNLGLADVQRDIDRLDYKVDLATPDLTLNKLDDGRVVISDPKLADDSSIVTRTYYVSCYNHAWAPAQGIFKITLTSTAGSFMITKTDEGDYDTVNGIVRQFGYIYIVWRVPHGDDRPSNFSVTSELVWHNNYHPDALHTAGPFGYDPEDRPRFWFTDINEEWDYYQATHGIGSISPDIAREYTIPDYIAPNTDTLVNDFRTGKVKWLGLETGDLILPSATAQEKVVVAAGNLARKASGNTNPLTPTGTYGDVNMASDDRMETLATNLNNLNSAMDNNTRQVEIVESDGVVTGLKSVKYNGTQTTLIEANPSGEMAEILHKLGIGGTVYKLASGGTTVVANPTGAATANLSKLQVDETIYQIVDGGGTDVEANPTGTPTDELNTIRIGQDIYEIVGGGGSFQKETIYSATAQADTYALSSPLTDFDAIEVLVKGGTNTMYRASGFFTTDELMAEEGDANARFAITTDGWYSYFSVTDENTLARCDTGSLWVYAIVGLKFGGGGSGGAFTDDVIFENTGSTNPNTITLNNAYTDYDEIVIKYTRPSNEGDYTWHSTYLVEALPLNSKIELTGWQPESQYLHYTFTNETTLTFYNQGVGVIIREIHGLKFGGGAGTIDTAMSDTSKNAVQNKVIKKYVDDEIAEFVDLTTTDIDDIITDVFGS